MQDFNYAVEMVNVNKYYGPVHANKDINLRVIKGEIHAIVGENGAGKTTLMNILYGMIEPTSGTVSINGQQVKIKSPREAISLGIGMVHQHFKLVPSFTVAENICLGHEYTKKFWRVDKHKMINHVKNISDKYGLDVNPESKVCDLSVGLLQRVEILKQLSRGADILILDEPTAVLTPLECVDLFNVLRNMSENGKTVILITHKLREVMDVSNHITVLHQGSTKGTLETRNTDEHEIASLMIGRESGVVALNKSEIQDRHVLLSIDQLCVRDTNNIEKIKNLSLNLHSGEILAIAGVGGNGQTELLEALMGFIEVEKGEVIINKKNITDCSIKERRKYCSFIPEDRMKTGLNLPGNVLDNLIAGRHNSKLFKDGPFLDYKKCKLFANEIVNDYQIVISSLDNETNSLSGGNQQKIVVARELSYNNDVLIVAQPSRGLDIGATAFIHEQIVNARNDNRAILLISTDLDEVFFLSDRILVLFAGEIVGSFTPEGISQKEIGLYMTGVKRDAVHH